MKTDTFIAFVESLRNDENNECITAVLEAYDVCLEGWIQDKVIKVGGTLAMIVGLLSGGADAKEINWHKILPLHKIYQNLPDGGFGRFSLVRMTSVAERQQHFLHLVSFH